MAERAAVVRNLVHLVTLARRHALDHGERPVVWESVGLCNPPNATTSLGVRCSCGRELWIESADLGNKSTEGTFVEKFRLHATRALSIQKAMSISLVVQGPEGIEALKLDPWDRVDTPAGPITVSALHAGQRIEGDREVRDVQWCILSRVGPRALRSPTAYELMLGD